MEKRVPFKGWLLPCVADCTAGHDLGGVLSSIPPGRRSGSRCSFPIPLACPRNLWALATFEFSLATSSIARRL